MKLKESILDDMTKKERNAVSRIKSNPKFFFSYAKRARKSKIGIGPLFDKNGNLQKDPKTIADILQDQYTSVFSDQNSSARVVPSTLTPETEIDELFFNISDIELAIREMNASSATIEEDIPSLVLKNCPASIAYPIFTCCKCII